MAVIADALDRLAADLTSAGVRATLDARDVNAPGAWVLPTKITDKMFGGGIVVEVDIYLIAPDHGAPRATRVLSGMVDLIRPWLAVDDSSLTDAVTLPSGGGPLPAWRITTHIELC